MGGHFITLQDTAGRDAGAGIPAGIFSCGMRTVSALLLSTPVLLAKQKPIHVITPQKGAGLVIGDDIIVTVVEI
jgi:hypothetical protein